MQKKVPDYANKSVINKKYNVKHSVSDYKKRLYKKRLVEPLRCKKRRLVNF